jgi:hypothetical protein
VGECLLTQSTKHDFQNDNLSLGLLLIEMLEPDSVFIDPSPSILQRPDSTEPDVVDFLSKTRSYRSDQLQQVGYENLLLDG